MMVAMSVISFAFLFCVALSHFLIKSSPFPSFVTAMFLFQEKIPTWCNFVARNKNIMIWIVWRVIYQKNFEIWWSLETASMPTLILFLSSAESHIASSWNNSADSKKWPAWALQNCRSWWSEFISFFFFGILALVRPLYKFAAFDFVPGGTIKWWMVFLLIPASFKPGTVYATRPVSSGFLPLLNFSFQMVAASCCTIALLFERPCTIFSSHNCL